MIHWSRHRLSCRDAGGTHAADPGEAPLTLAERARLAGLRVPKRRADWLLGRVAAKAVAARALAEVFPHDWPLRAIEIASHRNGMPYARLAPEADPVAGFEPGARLPVSVSISHTEGEALCAATCSAPTGDGSWRTLGVDLGLVEPRSPSFLATFFTEPEQRLVRDAAPADRALRATLIWCQKEAVLKALAVGLTVDTHGVCCLPEPGPADPAEWPIAPADDEWRPFVALCSPTLVPGGGALRGVWRAFPGFVGAFASRTMRVGPAAHQALSGAPMASQALELEAAADGATVACVVLP